VKHAATVLCANCERPISKKRLAVVPGAEYCVMCQPQFDVVVVASPTTGNPDNDCDPTEFQIFKPKAGEHEKTFLMFHGKGL
jgi:hypothetical protein